MENFDNCFSPDDCLSDIQSNCKRSKPNDFFQFQELNRNNTGIEIDFHPKELRIPSGHISAEVVLSSDNAESAELPRREILLNINDPFDNEVITHSIFKARLQDLTPIICFKLEMINSMTNSALAESLLTDINSVKDNNLTMLQSSVRRRLYDCINVLSSIGIIHKNGRTLTWAHDGFKLGSDKSGEGIMRLLSANVIEKETILKEKCERLREMLQKIFLYRKLAYRNINSLFCAKSLIPLPLLFIRIANSNNIECRLSRNHLTAQYTFDSPFSIIQDIELLKSLDLSHGNVSRLQNININQFLPETFHRATISMLNDINFNFSFDSSSLCASDSSLILDNFSRINWQPN